MSVLKSSRFSSTTGVQAFSGSEIGRPVCSGINKNDFRDFYAAICLAGMRLGEALNRVKGRIVKRKLDRVSPLAVRTGVDGGRT